MPTALLNLADYGRIRVMADRLGVDSIDREGRTVVIKFRPQAKIEYFLTPKFTLRSSLNYVFMQPRVTVTTPEGVISKHWNASHVSLAVGVGIYPFRK